MIFFAFLFLLSFFGLGHPHLAAAAMPFDPNGRIAAALGLQDADLVEVATSLVNRMLGFVALIALITFVTSGFYYLTAGGNTERVDTAKKMVRQTIIGIALILVAFILTTFVFETIIEAIPE
jgi:hypothetical protein